MIVCLIGILLIFISFGIGFIEGVKDKEWCKKRIMEDEYR